MTRARRISVFVLIAITLYIVIILTFGFLYQSTNSICYSKNDCIVNNFGDCFYFSLVSFQTIGYGDISPFLPIAKILIFIESIIQTIYISLFSGFLVFYFIKRPKDVFTTDNYFIRKANNKFLLSIRVGNKGEEIIDCNITVELLRINKKQIRTRLKTLCQKFSLMEKTWYAEFEISTDNELLELLKKIANGEEKLLLRFILTGIDSRSGSPVTVLKYYTPDKLKFGQNYLHVFTWDKDFKRSTLNWSNFNKIEQATDDIINEFKML